MSVTQLDVDVQAVRRSDMLRAGSARSFCLSGCLAATVPCMQIAITGRAVPPAPDKHLVTTDNSFSDRTRRAKEVSVRLHSID